MPEWARGKTADEVLALGEKFYKAALGAAPVAPVAPTPQTPAYTQPMSEPNQPVPPDPQLMFTDNARYQAELLAYQNQVYSAQMQQFAAPMLAQQATLAKDAAKRNSKRADVWTKYESEIDAQMVNVPLQARTVEAWDMAAKIVAGEHLDELAQERAASLAARTDTGTLSGGEVQPLNGTPAGDPISELFRTDSPAIANFKKQGMDANRVIAHARTMGHTPEAYAAMLTRGMSITAPTYVTSGEQTTLAPTA